MKVQLREIIETLEQIAPSQYAASWDNTGLQIGGADDPIRSILVSLDITPGVIQEAVKKKADLIISHHPLFFQPLRQIRTDTGAGRIVQSLLKAGIAVYSAHTNFDVMKNGMSNILGKALGLQGWSPIQEISVTDGTGWGRIGSLQEEKGFDDFVADLKEALQVQWLRWIGPPAKKVLKVACCGGSGASLLPDVLEHRPDLFITGDIKYHEAVHFQLEGITVLDIGHFASEQRMRKGLAKQLRQSLKECGKPIPVYTSRSEKDPFRIV